MNGPDKTQFYKVSQLAMLDYRGLFHIWPKGRPQLSRVSRCQQWRWAGLGAQPTVQLPGLEW